MRPATTLVLCPGLLNDGTIWRGVMALLDPGIDVRIMDFSRCDSMVEMAAKIDTATTGLDQPFTLAGFSMGGYAVLEFLSQHADRVSGVLLQSTAERAESDGQRSVRLKNIARAPTEFDQICKDLSTFTVGPARQDDMVLKRSMVDMFQRLGREVFVRQSTAVMQRADHTATLSAVGSNPSICLAIACGDEDKVTPLGWSRRMAEACPSARLAVIPGAGHMAPCEDPAIVASVIADLMR
jgi:pimeloyl-ACP methyl ester carboxylesterase